MLTARPPPSSGLTQNPFTGREKGLQRLQRLQGDTGAVSTVGVKGTGPLPWPGPAWPGAVNSAFALQLCDRISERLCSNWDAVLRSDEAQRHLRDLAH